MVMFTNKQDHFIDQEKFVSIIEKSQASILLLSDHYEVISANNQLIRIFEAKYVHTGRFFSEQLRATLKITICAQCIHICGLNGG